MTPSQGGYDILLARRFKANLRALSEIAPQAMSRLQPESRPPPPLAIDQTVPSAIVNVAIDDRLFYTDDARTISRSQVDAFVASNQSLSPPIMVVSEEDAPLHGIARGLEESFGERLMSAPRPYRVPPRYSPILTVFGIGTGAHVPLLLERYDVEHLILYESEPDLFHASLYAQDWVQIVRRFAGGGRSITLVYDPDGARASQTVFDAIQRHCAPLFIGSRFFRHHQTPAMETAVRIIEQYVPLLGIGWGYFKDERRQVLQTYENLGRVRGIIRRRWPVLPGASAIVAGAGPSLDAALPILHRIRDRVVLFSCGSSLRALARSGLEPDFHIELETAPGTALMLKTVPDQDLFARVPLIASNGMHPEVVDLFRTSYLFLRQDAVSAKLLGPDEHVVQRCFPIVGNAGVGIAAALGFRHVTLVGMDFGYRDTSQHHARGTFYVDDDTGTPYPDLSHIGLAHVPLPDFTRTPHRLPSVTGDILLADDTFKVSLVSLEALLNELPDLALTQYGDGARVAGAANIPIGQLDPAQFGGSRDAIIEQLRSRADPLEVDQRTYATRMAATVDAFDLAARQLRRLFKRRRNNTTDYLQLIETSWTHLTTETAAAFPAVFGLLCGASLTFFKTTLERILMIEEAGDRERFIALSQQRYLDLLDTMRIELDAFRRS